LIRNHNNKIKRKRGEKRSSENEEKVSRGIGGVID